MSPSNADVGDIYKDPPQIQRQIETVVNCNAILHWELVCSIGIVLYVHTFEICFVKGTFFFSDAILFSVNSGRI